MGFEYIVRIKWTPKIKADIQRLLESRIDFIGQINLETQVGFEFRSANAKTAWPDFRIAFEDYGLYLCHNASHIKWHDIHDLRKYLLENVHDFELEEL